MRRAALLVLVLLAALVFLPPRLAPAPDPAHLPPPARIVNLGGESVVNVAEIGTGPPVVLVHGLPSNLGDWASVPEKLAASGHRVVAYDRVGFGHSSRPEPEPGRYTMASNARELEALMDALGIERAALVGWSYGGGVVQVFAEEHPERVSHAVLLSSVGPAMVMGDDLFSRLVALPFAVGLFEWIRGIRPIANSMTRDSLVTVFSVEQDIPPGWMERTQAMLALPHTLRSMVLEIQRYDPAAMHPEALRMPVLILHGTADGDTPFSAAEDLHQRMPRSTFVSVPDGSHMLPVTHPDFVATTIHQFLSEG